jgi:hypothetical protein
MKPLTRIKIKGRYGDRHRSRKQSSEVHDLRSFRRVVTRMVVVLACSAPTVRLVANLAAAGRGSRS